MHFLWVAVVSLHLDSRLSAAYAGVVTFSSSMSSTRITSMHSKYYFDEEEPEGIAKSVSTYIPVYYKNTVLNVFTPLSLLSSSPFLRQRTMLGT